MKLLVLSDAGSVHTERWASWFENNGWEVGLFSLESCHIKTPRHYWQGKRSTTIGVIDYWLAKKQFENILDEFQPDIISAQYVVSYGWLAVQQNRVPVVSTAWGSDLLLLPQRSVLHRKRIATALKRANLVTVDNGNLFQAALEFTGEDKIRRVIMGVDREFLNSGVKKDFSDSGKLKIISPRGLQPVYDPMTIINAAAVVDKSVSFEIDLIGEGTRAVEIGEEIRQKSLEDIIKIIPRVSHDEYIKRLSGYDVYLSASLSDSTSVALMEAMAVGLYPIVSDIAGNQEWIIDKETGLIFSPGSPSGLAGAIQRAAQNRWKFMETAVINHARIEAEAVWEDNAVRLEKEMKRIINR